MTNDIDDRLSRRFGGEESNKNDGDDRNDSRSMNEQNEVRDQNDSSNENDKNDSRPLNVKRDWNARSFYLPDALDGDLSTAFKRLDLELAEAGSEMTLKKTRHYYPLIVELGLECMERIEQEELQERIERREQREGE